MRLFCTMYFCQTKRKILFKLHKCLSSTSFIYKVLSSWKESHFHEYLMLTLHLTEQTWAAPTLIVPELWRIVVEHPTIQVIKTLWMKINVMTMFIIMWSRPLLRCRVERGELYCLRVKYCLIFISFCFLIFLLTRFIFKFNLNKKSSVYIIFLYISLISIWQLRWFGLFLQQVNKFKHELCHDNCISANGASILIIQV